MKTYFKYILTIMMACFMLAACSKSSKEAKQEIITIETKGFENTLFYSGTILPIKSMVIPSPVDGVVVEMPFQYGEEVKTGDLLFLLSSEKFLSDYKTALMAYIKAKNEFDNNKVQLTESEFLHKNELISDDEHKMKKSNFYSAQLGLLQAKDVLEVLIRQLNIKNINLYNLSISDIEKITKAIHLQAGTDSNIRVISPVSGIVLAANKSEEETKKITKGDIVKQGDVLAMIGDLNGLSIQIKVNELTINQLKVGQKVKVTGIAFPDEVLNGMISRVDRQGEASNGGIPNFTVQIVVPTLTVLQRNTIHVGMTAKIEIAVNEKPNIMIPIAAIFEENGLSCVNVMDGRGKIKKTMIKTGKTTLDSAVVLSGLQLGDKIVVSHTG
ncbi:MAG: efflux RND transporter periplasmic adaptor subunit [Gammaproteobacteria bacterium]